MKTIFFLATFLFMSHGFADQVWFDQQGNSYSSPTQIKYSAEDTCQSECEDYFNDLKQTRSPASNWSCKTKEDGFSCAIDQKS